MSDLIVTLLFSIGYMTSIAGITFLILHLIDKSGEARRQKLSHESRVIALLETINQKLNSKP